MLLISSGNLCLLVIRNQLILLVIEKKTLFLEQPLAHRLVASPLLIEQENMTKTPHVEVPGKRKSNFICSSYLPKLFSVVHLFFVCVHWALNTGSCLFFELLC